MSKLIRFWHESENQFNRADIEDLVYMYGPDILIGGDPGWHKDFSESMYYVDAFGAKKHVYLFGPGMWDWSPEEQEEIKEAAESIGLDTTSDSWKTEWYDNGAWEKKVHSWFKYYNKEGFYSAEVDNLDAVMDQDPDKYIKFIERFDKFHKANKIKTKLMVKNLSEEQLKALIQYKPRETLFCEFGMFEDGSGDPQAQLDLAAKLGIQAITPLNGLRSTENYGTTRHGVAYSI